MLTSKESLINSRWMDGREKFTSVRSKNAGNTLCINEAFWANWRKLIRLAADCESAVPNDNVSLI